jgi:hypothetical protein
VTEIFRTLILPAADAPLARQIASTLSPVGGSGMWTTGLSADGNDPATHYVSTGLIGPSFAAIMPSQTYALDEQGRWVLTGSVRGQPAFVIAACAAADPPLKLTAAQVQGLMDRADISEQEPFVAFSRMGLKLIAGDAP